MPAIYNFYASNKLSMSALMINAKEDGMVAGLLEENGTNIAYSKTLTNLENLGYDTELDMDKKDKKELKKSLAQMKNTKEELKKFISSYEIGITKKQ